MALTITHQKVNAIADWTQADLDAQIALGNYPPGTVLADITLPSDWNDTHTVSGAAELVEVVDAGGDATCFPLLGTAATGALQPSTDLGLTYNATTNTLATTVFSGTATMSATVNVANEGTDTTCFPLFAVTSTGDQQPKTNASLTFNSNTGALGATTFNGVPLTTGGSASTYLDGSGAYSTPAGGGNVSGPGSSTDNAVALFDGATGTVIQNSVVIIDPATGDTTGLGDVTAGEFIGPLTGNVTGNVSGSSGSTTGNAATATALQTARNINGVSFNGTADITVTAAAGTLTGATLAATVVNSSLTSVGTLTNLTVTNPITGSITGNAATVSSANEATDTTCFPVFITASGTQALPLKNNTALTYNSNTGALGSTSFVGALTGNASTATALATGRTISISGDLSYTSPSFDGTGNVTAAGTLATVNANVGTFGSSTSIPTFTVNAKGLVTAASGNAVIAPAGTLTGNTLAANVLTSSLTSVGTLGSLAVTGAVTGATFNGVALTTGGAATNFLAEDGTYGVPTGTGGTVTDITVASANGFAGTSDGDPTAPELTISTTITGVLKGNGTAISAATAGTDYSAGTSALATGILKSTTTTGALTIAVAGDFPTLNQNTTGTAAISTTSTIANEATDTTCFPTFVTAATGDLGLKSNAGLTFDSNTATLGATLFQGPIQSFSTSTSSNLNVNGTSTASSTSVANYQLLAANTAYRVGVRGATNSTVTAGNSYASLLVGAQGITEAGSSSHPLLANVAVKAPAYVNGAGATTNAATVYIEGPQTGVTPSGLDLSLWVDAGNVQFDGNLTVVGTIGASNFSGSSSGTNTGDQTSVTGNAGTATALQNARTIGGVSFDGTANIVPQTIQSVNEATDTTCFPVFFTAATGDLGPKTNAGLTFNSNTGALGATSFSGAGTGLTGTAASLTAGTASAVAVGGITGLGTGVGTFLATPSSANLATAVTDETGSGALVFANTPTLVTPVLGAATATSINFGGQSLSNYTEGTFTPVVIGVTSAGTGTYSAQSGTYTRIGRVVFVRLHITLTAHTGTGGMRINNLPFTAASESAMTFGYYDTLNVGTGKQGLALIVSGSTNLDFYSSDPGGGAVVRTTIDPTCDFGLSGFYFV